MKFEKISMVFTGNPFFLTKGAGKIMEGFFFKDVFVFTTIFCFIRR